MARQGTPIQLAPETDDWRTDWENESKAFLALRDAEKELKSDEIVGVLMRFPRGDGEAVYLVTKESPLTVSLLVFGDAWTIEDAHIRGIRKTDVLEHKRRNAAMASLFG